MLKYLITLLKNSIPVTFNTSERKARNVEKLVSEHGNLTLPNSKTGRALNPETETCEKILWTQWHKSNDARDETLCVGQEWWWNSFTYPEKFITM